MDHLTELNLLIEKDIKNITKCSNNLTENILNVLKKRI